MESNKPHLSAQQLHELDSIWKSKLPPIDWGNGSGMSLMNYRERKWSDDLAVAVAENAGSSLLAKLPETGRPTDLAGQVAAYFVKRFNFSPECLVNLGSGDNPQSKLLSHGNMLSMGSCFVYMIQTPEPMVDLNARGNSMYDGLGRPFLFFCRTNGTLVWDWVRENYKKDFAEMDQTLTQRPINAAKRRNAKVWQPVNESLPVSPIIDNADARLGRGDWTLVYPDIVDSSLIITRHYAREFETPGATLTLTGGAARSDHIVRRVATIFGCPVAVAPAGGGASAGGAVSALKTVCIQRGIECDLS